MAEEFLFNKSIYCIVRNFICHVLLFLHREIAIASMIFWIMVYVTIIIRLRSPITFVPIAHVVLMSGIYEFYFNFFKFIFYFSCVTGFFMLSSHKWAEKGDYYCNSIFIYMTTFLFMFFFEPC
jgi:hypothetical protein